MLDLELVKKHVHRTDLTRSSKLLSVLALNGDRVKPVSEILRICESAGLREARTWNISQILARTNGLAIRVQRGWELSPRGLEHISRMLGVGQAAKPASQAADSLRQYLGSLKHPDTRVFVEEAIGCLEHRLYRAAVVLSWVGAMSVLYDHIVAAHLTTFNSEALRRDTKWRQARTRDDLTQMKEYDFLNALEAVSIIGKSVKQILTQRLQLRNACGHPSSLQIGENTVAEHIEQLIVNIFSKF